MPPRTGRHLASGSQFSTGRRNVALNVLPVVRKLQATGLTSHNAIADKLNKRHVPRPYEGQVDHVQVGAVLERAVA